jgi:(2S)-methylsuccinyl-CoA dehydrogenase
MNAALAAAENYAAAARAAVQERVAASSLDAQQHAAHGYAWIETAVEALRALHAWGERQNGAAERLVVAIGTGETLAQLAGGLPMGQNEFVRPADFGLESHVAALSSAAQGNSVANRARLIELLAEGATISDRFEDDLLDTIRAQYRRFTDERILPQAHGWHLANELIPDAIIAEMADLGTFGICIAEEFGGLGLGKLVMCVVTEELSRGWIGTGSLGTRSEIAGELIMMGGTEAQKQQWLPPKSPRAKCCPPQYSPNPTPVPTWPACRRARCGPEGWEITARKTGSPTPRAPT